MEFTTGQVVRISNEAPVIEYAKGRLGIVTEVEKQKLGTKYTVSVVSLRVSVSELFLRVGPDEIVH